MRKKKIRKLIETPIEDVAPVKYKHGMGDMFEQILAEIAEKGVSGNPFYRLWREQREFHIDQNITSDDPRWNFTYREDLKPVHKGVQEDIEFGQILGDEAKHQRKFVSWFIPSPENIQWISQFGKIVEMGAGHGYLAQLLREAGCDVVAFDNCLEGENFGQVQEGTPEILADYGDRVLLLCWPPQSVHKGHEMSLSCLKHYPGKDLIYIGEGGGCRGSGGSGGRGDEFDRKQGSCATPEFFDELEKNWREMSMKSCPRMPNIYDSIWHYQRK